VLYSIPRYCEEKNVDNLPEWVAAVALTMQAAVFVWQTTVFKHHARSQKLIAEVLQKQEEIMKRQEEISADVSKFMRLGALKEERGRLFDSLRLMRAQVITAIEKTRVSSQSKEGVEAMDAAWNALVDSCTTCQKELITVEISAELKNYFLNYAMKAVGIANKRPAGFANAQPLTDLNAEYADYNTKMIEAVRTPVDI
jgi:hypothetical protein